MKNLDFLEEIQSQSTWRLFGLSVITGGIYEAYYIHKLTKQINPIVEIGKRLSNALINSIFVLCYLSVIFRIVEKFFEENMEIGIATLLIMLVTRIALITWAFKIRSRIHVHCELDKKTYMWFSAFWTFFYAPIYLNYRINCLVENMNHPDFVIEPNPS